MPFIDSKKPVAIFNSRRTLTSAAAVLAVVIQAACGGSSATTPPPATVSAPAGLAYDANPAVYHLGAPIAANGPHSSGGAVASYRVSPALPAGLTLDAVTGVVSGTPAAITAQASYSVTASNAGGSTSSALTITVTDAPPSQLTYGSPQATYTKGVAIPANAPGSAGGAVTRYAVSPALPAGLAIDAATGVISGTPTEVTAGFSYTVTASNAGGSTTTHVQIAVKDVAPGGLTYAANPVTYFLNNAIAPNAPSSTGGVATTYFASPPLPPGLLLDSATGIISGTPLVTGQGTYTVTASNSGGSVNCALVLTIIAKPPAGLTYTTNPVTVTKGLAMTPDQPSSTGGPILSYGVSPALPTGLSLDPATGIVSGTPAAITPSATYVVTATNTGGSATANLILAVQDQAPANLTYATNPSSYTQSIAIQPNVPSNTGGVILGYTVSPALPAGLVLDPGTGVISGTPTALATQATYVVTGTNATGSTTCNFVTSVVPDPIPPPDASNVTAPIFATAAKAGYQASTQDQGTANGMTYLWTVTNGSITAGQGTPVVTFTAGTVGALGVQVKVTNLGGSSTGSAQVSVEPAPTAPIFAQDQVLTGSNAVLASVPPQSNMTYQWSVTGAGASLSSSGTANVAAYSVGQSPGPYQLSVTVQNRAGDQLTASRTLNVVSNMFLPDAHTAPQRYQHSTTTLNDGRVLVAGGFDPSWVTATAWLYDPYSNTWALVGSLTDARATHTATLLADGRVLVVGGEGSDNNLTPLASAEIFDPATRTWSTAGFMSTNRQNHSATLLSSGKVLVAGGVPILSSSSFIFLDSSEIYDPVTNTWGGSGTMSQVRAYHTATLLPDGRVVLVGGESQQGSVGWQRTIDIFDPKTQAWTAGTNMTASRVGHTADLLANGKVLVAGGNGSAQPGSALLFNPTANGGLGSWSSVSNTMANPRYQHQSVVLQSGKVLVVAGKDATSSSQEVASAELYDPSRNAWSGAGTLNYSTYDNGAALLPGGKVYAFGGHSSSSATMVSSNGQIYDPAQNLWSSAGGMIYARTTHTTTTLPDGTLLVAGGIGTRGNIGAVEIFDPVAGAWSLTGSLITPRSQHSASLLGDGTVLVTGGFVGGAGLTSSAEIYTPATKTWTSAPAMAVGRAEHSSTTLADGRVLVAGGRSTVSSTPVNASAAIFDPVNGSWTPVPDMSDARYGHTAVLINGKVLVSGGRNGNTLLNSAEVFDPGSNTWTTVAPMITPRYGATAIVLTNGRVLLAGGQSNATIVSNTAEIYDPAANTWTAAASMIGARFLHAAALLPGGQVVVLGGRSGPSGPNAATAERYDPIADLWTSISNLSTPRYGNSATTLPDGSVISIGGQPGSMPETWKP
jgi:N-acetylneuraminic acid mutarotase